MKRLLILTVSAILFVFSVSCKADTAPSEPSEPSGGAPTSSGAPAEAPNGTTQNFTSIDAEITKGTLYIRSGDAFSVTDRAEYEIADGTLYLKNNGVKETVLVLPEGESYENLRLRMENGHIYAEHSFRVQTLNLEGEKGDARLDAISVSEGSTICITDGSASLCGDLGDAVSATCKNGEMNIQLPFAQTDSSYEITVSEGEIRLGTEKYHGKSFCRTIDNGGERLLKLNSAHGDISVEFNKK